MQLLPSQELAINFFFLMIGCLADKDY